VTSFALNWGAGNDSLIDLTRSGILKTSTGNGFNNIATGVQSFVVDAGGGIDALFVGGVLKRWNGTSWALLAPGVRSIWLINNGSTLDALLTNGTIRQFSV
jgi:hypothetical protein